MLYGMPSLIEFESIEDNLNLCKELGLDFVEINMNMFYCLPENNQPEAVRRSLIEKGLRLTMHFPEEIDFGTFYPEIAEANLALFKRYLEYAAQIGGEIINIHLQPGAAITLPERKVYAYEKFIDRYTANLLRSFSGVTALAEEKKIKACVENIEVPEFLKQVFWDLRAIKKLGFTYDVGHDAKGGYNVAELYNSLGKRVIHMHLHDYNGKLDHQPLFTGTIPIKERLAFAKENDMRVVIEVKTKAALEKSVERLSQYF